MLPRGLACALFIVLASCATKPKIAPAPHSLPQMFYSLKQSRFSAFSCEISSLLLKEFSDFEYEMLFKELFSREPSLQEKGMLRKLSWKVSNNNAKQDVIPSPEIKDFPSRESQDLVEKMTGLLNVANKVLTLTYLETFADRPDLSEVVIGEKFFLILDINSQVVAELDFNRKKYRIFFSDKNDQLEVKTSPLGSMQIPGEIEVRVAGKQARVEPWFKMAGGFPQIQQLNIFVPQMGRTALKFSFENCSYSRIPDQ